MATPISPLKPQARPSARRRRPGRCTRLTSGRASQVPTRLKISGLERQHHHRRGDLAADALRRAAPHSLLTTAEAGDQWQTLVPCRRVSSTEATGAIGPGKQKRHLTGRIQGLRSSGPPRKAIEHGSTSMVMQVGRRNHTQSVSTSVGSKACSSRQTPRFLAITASSFIAGKLSLYPGLAPRQTAVTDHCSIVENLRAGQSPACGLPNAR